MSYIIDKETPVSDIIDGDWTTEPVTIEPVTTEPVTTEPVDN